MIHLVVKALNESLVGKKVPEKWDGKAGRYIEILLKDLGLDMQTGYGPDILDQKLEVKSRDIDSISPLTIATMRYSDILETSYYDSLLCDKFQHHIRINTQYERIVNVCYWDFRSPLIQDEIAKAYDFGKHQLLQKGEISCTKANNFGYFENTDKRYNDLYAFRLTDKNMQRLAGLSKSVYNNIFEEA